MSAMAGRLGCCLSSASKVGSKYKRGATIKNENAINVPKAFSPLGGIWPIDQL